MFVSDQLIIWDRVGVPGRLPHLLGCLTYLAFPLDFIAPLAALIIPLFLFKQKIHPLNHESHHMKEKWSPELFPSLWTPVSSSDTQTRRSADATATKSVFKSASPCWFILYSFCVLWSTYLTCFNTLPFLFHQAIYDRREFLFASFYFWK